MILLDGKKLSQKILSDLEMKIEDLNQMINLDIVLVGNDPSSQKYVTLKHQRAAQVGIGGQLHRLPSDISESKLISLVDTLNNSPNVTGFFIQLPLPKNLHKDVILNSIFPNKDADGLVLNSGIAPAVVRGIIQLLDEYKLNFVGKNIVIINDSQLIGQPLKNIFENRHLDVVLCNGKTQNLAQVTKTADLLISATGVKDIITADMVKPEAVVIDVANGDINFDSVSQIASYITPTFGGVGPMTVASLMQNTFDLAIRNS